jgi:hypothetical protein
VGLEHPVAGQAVAVADRERLAQARGAVAGGPELADPAVAHERVERSQRLLQRHRLVVLVGVEEVDAVRLQARQRGLGALLDLLGADAGEVPDLGRDDHLVAVAARGHPGADDRLRLAAAVALGPDGVDVRGIEQVAAGRRVGVEHGEGLLLVDRPAEDVAPQTQGIPIAQDPVVLGHRHPSSRARLKVVFPRVGAIAAIARETPPACAAEPLRNPGATCSVYPHTVFSISDRTRRKRLHGAEGEPARQAPLMSRSAPSQWRARSSCLRILPTPDFGSGSLRSSIERGVL